MEYLNHFGYLGLFFAAFLAATIIPFSSEALLGWMVLNKFDQTGLIITATSGNVLGSMFNYYLGYKGNYFLLQKILRMSFESIKKAEKSFQKFGTPGLIFAWVPILGDPLTVAAGLFKVNFIVFTILVTVGKLARYIFVVIGISLF